MTAIGLSVVFCVSTPKSRNDPFQQLLISITPMQARFFRVKNIQFIRKNRAGVNTHI